MRLIKTITNKTDIAKVYYSSEWIEYQVKAWQAGQRFAAGDYFTDDKEDALGTAKLMMGIK